jgi:hypothetical protein
MTTFSDTSLVCLGSIVATFLFGCAVLAVLEKVLHDDRYTGKFALTHTVFGVISGLLVFYDEVGDPANDIVWYMSFIVAGLYLAFGTFAVYMVLKGRTTAYA